MSQWMVFDIGGTWFRSASYDSAAHRLGAVMKIPSVSHHSHPDWSLERRLEHLVESIVSAVQEQHRQQAVSRLAIAFPGPVSASGEVMAAPPLFGSITKPIPLVQLLKSRLPAVEVHLLNDVTAATWRYVPEELGDFCLLTVSTGIGNKVFAGGRILLTAEGRGGEIGHLCVDTSVDAPPCDCGGRGHIGAFSSGRGAEALARRRAQLAPGEFSRSRLCEAVNGEANSIDALNLAQSAIAGDEFSLAIVRQSQLPLAIGIASIQASIGIERFIFMGGFALALGDLYRQILAGHLRQLGLFGIPDEEIDRMLILGHNDDLHGLLGAALFLVANQ